MNVDVTAPEVFFIADYLRDRLSADHVAAIARHVEETWRQTRNLTRAERQRARIPCSMLVDGRCIVYPVRPHRLEIRNGAFRQPHLVASEPIREHRCLRVASGSGPSSMVSATTAWSVATDQRTAGSRGRTSSGVAPPQWPRLPTPRGERQGESPARRHRWLK